ncbi:hypothetical protein HW49_04265 [Porphyromonadaceae bacterium COT-184 OH4590]|nr:hypothetical protein HW49_04265 [Porphyromonadaceae bacterium COT-184 OH4590]
MYKFFKVAEFDAVGGPQNATMGQDGFMETPTKKGRFVVGYIGKHRSYSRYGFSSEVAWGTPLREHQGKVQIYINKSWIDLSKYTKAYHGYTEESILDYLKKWNKKLTTFNDEKGKYELPDSWIYNDFGHLTIKYFKDSNENYKLDKGEAFMGDFIHTTSKDEVATIKGRVVSLSGSHGCIHVKPNDIDVLVKYYIKIGSIVEVKSYQEKTAMTTFEQSYGRPPYETHFYPGKRKIFIYKVTKIQQ